MMNNNEAHEKARKRAAKAQMPALLRVRCEGKIHTLAWQPRGRITMLNHAPKEARALRTMKALGDETCGCLKAMLMVRADGRIWGEWRPLVRDVQAVRAERGEEKPPDEPPARVALENRLQALDDLRRRVIRDLSGAAAVYLPTGVSVGLSCPEARPGITSYARHSFSVNGRWRDFALHVTIVVNLTWARLVSAGLHVVEEMVAVEVRYVDGATEVLLGRPGTEGGRPTIKAQWARVQSKNAIGPSLPKDEWYVVEWLES